MIHFELPIQAVAKGRPRFSRRGNFVHTYTPEKTKDFETEVKRLARVHAPKEPLPAALLLYVTFWLRKPQRPKRSLPITKPDIDNLSKCLTDSLNEVLWEDDSQITDEFSAKRYSPGEPKIEVLILPANTPYTLRFALQDKNEVIVTGSERAIKRVPLWTTMNQYDDMALHNSCVINQVLER